MTVRWPTIKEAPAQIELVVLDTVIHTNVSQTKSIHSSRSRHPTMTPDEVVQKQLDAYNRKDIEGFMSGWADEAQYYAHPDTLMASGAAAIRERHIGRFKEPNLYGALIDRVVLGSIVVDHERVTRTFPEGPGMVEVVAIYEVQGEKIVKAWFIIGQRQLTAP